MARDTVEIACAADWPPLPRGRPLGEIPRDAPAIVIHEPVLEEILDYSHADLVREQGGFLLGVFRAEPTCYVELRHFLPAAQVRSNAVSLTFRHDTWAALTREATERFPDAQVAGWHHTHPGWGVFLSAYDRFIHRHYFSQSWQVALVVDPRRQELGFFQWRQGEIVNCGFVCVPALPSPPRLPADR